MFKGTISTLAAIGCALLKKDRLATQLPWSILVHELNTDLLVEAVFFANGVEFYHAPARGLTLVLVRPDGTRKDSQTFDTMRLGEEGSGYSKMG